MRTRDLLGGCVGAALLTLIASCATVPPVQLAFAVGRDGSANGRPLPCDGAPIADPAGEALPGPVLRVTSWNIHKNGDAGWDADLARFAADTDLLLLQEAALSAPLRKLLADADFDALLASSFALDGHETGVLTAARVRPANGCVQRQFEPLIRLPKSAVITRYRIEGSAETLAVANVHSINFALTLGDYREQLEAVARELSGHRGPVIVAGDFNTWNAVRVQAVDDVMKRLRLVPVLPEVDLRTRFLGQQVDHVYVRGLDVVEARAIEVRSSDHNPVVATLRLSGSR
jgi:endonuclease/exonuclease/phosphatase (EEP) superfamily protein YafD